MVLGVLGYKIFVPIVKKELKIENKIDDDEILYLSPSYAAMFVLEMIRNGKTEWKMEDGTTLKELEEKELR